MKRYERIFLMPSARRARGIMIYKVTNLVNGKFYIGKCGMTPAVRMGQHNVRMRGGSATKFHNAIRKYGANAFCVSILAYCETHQDAYVLEQRLISSLCPDYNLTDGGIGSLGHKVSAEARAKISARNKGNKYCLGIKRPPQRIKDLCAAAAKVTCEPVMSLENGRAFKSIRAAEKFYGLAAGSRIGLALGKPNLTVAGYHWVHTW